MNLEKEHFSSCGHEGLLEEVTFEQRPRCEELKEKHLRQRGHRYQSLEVGQGSVSVRTGKGLL